MIEKEKSELLEENKKLKILLYKLKIDLEKYRKNYEEELISNQKKEFDLLNVFDISNELALERNPANIEKVLFYFIIGHFNFKPILLLKYDKEENSETMTVGSVFGISQKKYANYGFSINQEELNLISEKKEIFKVDEANVPFYLLEKVEFFSEIRKIGINYILPIINQKNKKMLMLFGERQGNNILTASEMTILKVLKNAAAISLENSRLITELDQKNIELSKNLGLVSELYEKIQKAYDELKEIDKLKTDFLNLISHELRTPLTSIKAYTDTLLTDQIEITVDEQKEFIKVISAESQRMEDLINKILMYVELESKRYKFNYIQLKPVLLINDILEELKSKISEKMHTLEFNQEHFKDLVITADYQMIKTTFYNVIENAIKFTESNGKINITVQEENSDFILCVKDNGIGIEFEDKEKIFKKFTIGEDINYHGQGLGISLATAKFIVEEGHNGKIWYEKNKDQTGVTFFIKIPKKR